MLELTRIKQKEDNPLSKNFLFITFLLFPVMSHASKKIEELNNDDLKPKLILKGNSKKSIEVKGFSITPKTPEKFKDITLELSTNTHYSIIGNTDLNSTKTQNNNNQSIKSRKQPQDQGPKEHNSTQKKIRKLEKLEYQFFPSRCLAKVEIYNKDNTTCRISGFLVHPNIVLTAAERFLVNEECNLSKPTSICCYFGKNHDYVMDYSSVKSIYFPCITLEQNFGVGKFSKFQTRGFHHLALIVLEKKVGNRLGYLGLGTIQFSNQLNNNIFLAGYPYYVPNKISEKQKAQDTIFHRPIFSPSKYGYHERIISYMGFMDQGDAGSPILTHPKDQDPFAVGLHSISINKHMCSENKDLNLGYIFDENMIKDLKTSIDYITEITENGMPEIKDISTFKEKLNNDEYKYIGFFYFLKETKIFTTILTDEGIKLSN